MQLDMSKIETKLVQWLKDYLKNSGANGYVVGMSGGIDSACTAVLSKKAAGENTLGVIMPCYSKPQDMADAKAVADKFGIKTVTVDLTPVLDTHAKQIGDDPKSKELWIANMKPRLRMVTLYYYANKHNYLVSGTDNRTENLTRYFTKGGDGLVDLNAIGNLYKTQVRALARHLGIPEQVITKPPSAGLWEGQTDEGELGITYELLDKILEALFDKKMKPEEVAKNIGTDLSKVQEVLERHVKNSHKVEMPSSGPID